jgi:hypothetical protein
MYIYINSWVQDPINALKLYLWNNLLTFNGQQIVGLCKLLTVNVVNF